MNYTNDRPINAISLFSGIGGFEVAAQLVFGDRYRTIQFVEIDRHAQQVLQSHFPNVPIWSDINTYHPPQLNATKTPTIIVGGFPCTDTSCAGNKKGLAGNESGLWWEMYRIILEAQPDFVVIENPEGVIHRGLRSILGGLRMAGYSCEVELISAAELGAPHRRNRVFVVAHSNHLALESRKGWQSWSESARNDIERARQIGARSKTQSATVSMDDEFPNYLAGLSRFGWWLNNPPPSSAGIATKIAGRAEKINLAGRSIVPLQAAVALMRVQFLAQFLPERQQHLR